MEPLQESCDGAFGRVHVMSVVHLYLNLDCKRRVLEPSCGGTLGLQYPNHAERLTVDQDRLADRVATGVPESSSA
jgi:hypothetical protein